MSKELESMVKHLTAAHKQMQTANKEMQVVAAESGTLMAKLSRASKTLEDTMTLEALLKKTAAANEPKADTPERKAFLLKRQEQFKARLKLLTRIHKEFTAIPSIKKGKFILNEWDVPNSPIKAIKQTERAFRRIDAIHDLVAEYARMVKADKKRQNGR